MTNALQVRVNSYAEMSVPPALTRVLGWSQGDRVWARQRGDRLYFGLGDGGDTRSAFGVHRTQESVRIRIDGLLLSASRLKPERGGIALPAWIAKDILVVDVSPLRVGGSGIDAGLRRTPVRLGGPPPARGEYDGTGAA